MEAPAFQPAELSLFIPASGPPFHVLCVALGHNPDPLRVSWVLKGQYKEDEDTTGAAGEPVVSWLQLPWEMAGISVTCQGLHQTGVSEVVLPLPRGQGENRGPRGCAPAPVQPSGTLTPVPSWQTGRSG